MCVCVCECVCKSCMNLFAIKLVVVKSVLAMMDSFGTSAHKLIAGSGATTACQGLFLVG